MLEKRTNLKESQKRKQQKQESDRRFNREEKTKKSRMKIAAYWLASLVLCVCAGMALVFVFNKFGNENREKKVKQTNELAKEMRGENVSDDVDEYMQSLQDAYSASGVQEETDDKDKGYDLPVDATAEKKAKKDCESVMNLVKSLYQSSVQQTGDEKQIDAEKQLEMEEVLAKKGYTAFLSSGSVDMKNYEGFETFLNKAKDGKKAEAAIYQVKSSGEVDRLLFTYDKKDMYVLWSSCEWNEEEKLEIVTNYTRIESWEYTKKGWFMYTLCVPETPEVMEAINGDAIIRIKPMHAEYRELVTKYFAVIGYQGNNLFLTDWNQKNMKSLDFAASFEYLYQIEKGEQLDEGKYEPGIDKSEFETLLQSYLPITKKQIEKNTKMNSKKTKYLWECLGCGNYDVDDFGMSFPEITGKKENADGSVTYTIDAVCDQLRTDCALTHELTVKFDTKGKPHFLANKVLYQGDSVTTYKQRVE